MYNLRSNHNLAQFNPFPIAPAHLIYCNTWPFLVYVRATVFTLYTQGKSILSVTFYDVPTERTDYESWLVCIVTQDKCIFV